MPKLLDVIKEKGLTHEQVINMITEIQEVSDEVIEEPTEESTESITEPIDDVIEEEPLPEVDNIVEPELLTVSQVELTKLISDAVEEKLKARRAAPSKGKVIDKTQLHEEPATPTKREVATEGWFEVIV